MRRARTAGEKSLTGEQTGRGCARNRSRGAGWGECRGEAMPQPAVPQRLLRALGFIPSAPHPEQPPEVTKQGSDMVRFAFCRRSLWNVCLDRNTSPNTFREREREKRELWSKNKQIEKTPFGCSVEKLTINICWLSGDRPTVHLICQNILSLQRAPSGW